MLSTHLEPATLHADLNHPYSLDYDDIYFSQQGGLAEKQHVFLQANQLPQRWQDTSSFTIGELGFGTGLSFLSTWALWAQSKAQNGQLHYLSIEKHPIEAQCLQRIHQNWPTLIP